MVADAGPEWRLIDLSYPSVHRNLALEEALARRIAVGTSVPIVRLWRNPPSVIVGRFQEVREEVDVEFCRENGIAIARRFSGGGAVFHDYGNLNLSIIAPRTNPISPNEIHRRNSSIIVDMLARNGLRGELVPPNSIHVNSRKISGAAAATGQGFVLWHASILISTDTHKLIRALAPSRALSKTRSIRSHWHPVTTLSEVQGRTIDFQHVLKTLIESCGTIMGSLSETNGRLGEEEHSLREFYEGKYSSDDWNWNGKWEPGKELEKSDRAHTTIAV